MEELLRKSINNHSQMTHIGENILRYTSKVAKHKARRFIRGMLGDLKNWNYDEVLNYGEMPKVLETIKYLQDN